MASPPLRGPPGGSRKNLRPEAKPYKTANCGVGRYIIYKQKYFLEKVCKVKNVLYLCAVFQNRERLSIDLKTKASKITSI
jgi:hypothetical protein